MSAAQASGFLNYIREPLGYQVIVTRKIGSKEIHKVRSLPQTIGWRYWPGAHGQAPCGCPVCWDRGRMNSRNIREKWLEQEKELGQAVKSGAIQAPP